MRIADNHWLKTTPIAHRGLWGADIIENSLTAYQNAVDFGYAIELDLYTSTDGVLYSFHDATLKRMTGADGYIWDFDSKYIDTLRLSGTDEHIPTFKEVLQLVGGSVPLIIEIKNQPDKMIVERILHQLEGYNGEYALQSFNPLYINKVRKIAPDVIRGILGTSDAKGEKPFVRFILKHLALNFLIKPDFISMNQIDLPLPKSKTKGKTVLTWTITSQDGWNKVKPYCDNLIFEKFIPEE